MGSGAQSFKQMRYGSYSLPVWLNSGWTVLSAKVKSIKPILILRQARKSRSL